MSRIDWRTEAVRCRIGWHDFHWPEHTMFSWELWQDVHIECWRGCGARKIRRCDRDQHWTERHEELTEAQVSA